MLVNLTPHTLSIYDGETLVVTLPPSGQVARVSIETQRLSVMDKVPLYVQQPGEVVGLPEPDGALFVVSALVRLAVPNRRDVASPGELVRNEAGQPVGCKGLVLNGSHMF